MSLRPLFLLDPDLVFLNHGSFGACPREVFEVYQGWQREMEHNPVAFLGRRSAGLLAEARAELGRLLNAAPADLAWVANATTGVNLVARSLDLQPGDEVLATDHEYGACDAAWRVACAARGASYRRVEIPLPFDSAAWVQRLLDAVTPRTRMLFASHITSTTALLFPVAELCRQARSRGVLTLIDGAHAPGQIDLDLAAVGADFYVGNCHKWLCAPKGAAFLHARAEHQARLQAGVVSWGYVAGADGDAAAPDQGGDNRFSGFNAYTGHTLLERRLLWQGTRDIAAFLAVPAAIHFQARHDWPRLRLRCHDLALDTARRVAARNGLAPIAADGDHAQMVPIPVRCADAGALRARLFDHHGIEVAVTLHGEHSFVRLSVQAYTSQAELQALVDALAAEGV
jgi:isopenicillin-N epimerase